MSTDTTLQDFLISLEHERCRCLVQQDFDRLGDLISSDLVHTHTRGNSDDRNAYLRFMQTIVESLDVRREGLQVRLFGDTAVMHGKQFSRSRLRGTANEATVEAQVTQVWTKESDGAWRQVAFHATPLGAPPPAVAR